MLGLTYITYLSIILLAGILSQYLSEKTNLPNVFYLMISGALLGVLKYNHSYLLDFPNEFLVAIGILALSMIIFDSSSRLPLKEFDTLSGEALKFIALQSFLILIIVSTTTYFIFHKNSFFTALILSALLIGTSPETTNNLLKRVGKKTVIEFLKIESILNSPLTIILPFLILDFNKIIITHTETFVNYITTFLQQVIVGIGAGVVVGIIFFRKMRERYSKTISPLLLIASSVLTYVLAENLQGNGVLAVTTLGLFFGNMYVKQKNTLKEFSSFMAHLLEILIFIFLGIITRVDTMQVDLIIKTLIIYGIYLLTRFVSAYLLYKRSSLKNLLFISFVAPKGITTAIAAFSIISLHPKFSTIKQSVLLLIFLSVIFSTFFLKIYQKMEEKQDQNQTVIDNSRISKNRLNKKKADALN